jgi:asparagine synthase (glutamine-hydrolysing)
MCGVVGLIAPGALGLPDDLDRMSDAVAHRGPDDAGRWVDSQAGVGFGHRRLSIVDLSPAGHQPMVSADGRWVLVLNGEVYDHHEHRQRLEAHGVQFRGHSDTEVLLELIARQGPEAAVAAVDGMFALGAWDRQERVLVLARDRLGEKPLYYGRVGGAFAFASELSALRRLPQCPTEPDPQALGEYLRLGFVPSPLSILPGIHKLAAGCVVRVSAGGQAGTPTPYWSLVDVAHAGRAAPLSAPDDELVDLADAVLRRSVERRIEADVPVGAFLSGGLDSSTIAALAQAVSGRPVRTFTVAVGGPGDESADAAAVARHLGTDHTTLPLPEIDAVDLARRAASIYDEPFADPSGIPTALLCAAARRHVTVCLSGDGADELLAGYNRYQVARGSLSRALGLPKPVRGAAAGALRAVSPGRWDQLGRGVAGRAPALGTKVHKLAGALSAADPFGAYLSLATQWDPAVVMLEPVPALAPVGVLPGASALEAMLLADQQRTLPDDMLVKVDRASMAVALEVRVPFLDHRFVELTWRMPERARMRGGQGKWLVRNVLDRYVPRQLLDRPKMGFDPPLAQWLRGPLREWSHDLLAPDRLRRQGLIEPEPVAAALAAHDSGRENLDYRLWTMLMLQTWLDAKDVA